MIAPHRTSSYSLNTSRIHRLSPALLPKWGTQQRQGSGTHSPPGLLLLPRCSRPQQGKFLMQEDLICLYTTAEALSREAQYVWTGTGWEFLDEKLLFGKASVL